MPIFYMDYDNGLDATTNTPLGWWSVSYTNGNGVAPIADETVTGAISLKTAKLTVVTPPTTGTWAGGNAAGTMYFYGKSGAFQAETVNSTSASFTIAGDFTYCAWKTITTGATAARIAPGDTIRIAKSSIPTSMGQDALWTTVAEANGGLQAAKVVTGVANNGSGLIRVTVASHGWVNNDVIQILTVGGTVESHGSWLITKITDNTFDLIGSTFTNAYTSGGTAQNINAKAVVLTTAVNQIIDNCEIDWTVGAQTTSAAIDIIDWKEGSSSVRIITAATCNANQIIAKYGLPAALDLNAGNYQQVSFWIKNNTTALAAGDLQVRLYGEVACTTLRDTLSIPAIPSTARWVPITINFGGNLGTGGTIQGIALYTTVQFNAKTVYIDNFIACKATSANDSLSLQSLISKNTLAKFTESATSYGNEGWYGIQSIAGQGTTNAGRIILLDNHTNTLSNAGRGYYGTTESVPLYKKETTKLVMTSSATAIIMSTTEAGTAANYIQYQGGYDSATNTQNGDTFFDALNGYGYPILSGHSYLRYSYLSYCRAYSGTGINSNVVFNYIDILPDSTNCTNVGFLFASAANLNTVNVIGNTNNNSIGVYFGGNLADKNIVNKVIRCNNNITRGINSYGSYYNIVKDVNACNNINAIAFEAGAAYNKVLNIYCDRNSSSIYASNASENFICGGTVANGQVGNNLGASTYINNVYLIPTGIGNSNYTNSRMYLTNINQDTNYHYIVTDQGRVESDAVTVHPSPASGISWKITTTSSIRNADNPIWLSIAKIACEANKLVTVKCWFKLSIVTYAEGALVCREGQLLGVNFTSATTISSITDWQQLQIQFQPTQSGVVEIEGWGYPILGGANISVWIDDIDVTQE